MPRRKRPVTVAEIREALDFPEPDDDFEGVVRQLMRGAGAKRKPAAQRERTYSKHEKQMPLARGNDE